MKHIKCLFGVAAFRLRRFNALWRILKGPWRILVVATAMIIVVAGCETNRQEEMPKRNVGVQSCKADADCTGGKLCFDGICKADAASGSGGECDDSFDCPADDELCKDGACVGIEEWKDDGETDEDEGDAVADKDVGAISEDNEVKIKTGPTSITVTCDKDLSKKEYTAKCGEGECDWSVTPDLPTGITQTEDNNKLAISGKVDPKICVDKADKDETFTITACANGTTDCVSKDVTLKFKMDKLELVGVQDKITVTKGDDFELMLKATGGSGEYGWSIDCDTFGETHDDTYCLVSDTESGINIVEDKITGQVSKIGHFYLPIVVTDKKTNATQLKTVELTVEDKTDFQVTVKVDEIVQNTKGTLSYGQITVPYESKLTLTVPDSSSYYVKYGAWVDKTKTSTIKPDQSLPLELEGKKVTFINSAGQEKVVVFEKIIFEPDPCNFKIVRTSPSDAEVFEENLGEEIDATFTIEGGAKDAEYEWTVKREATSKFKSKITTEEISCDDGPTCVPSGKFSYKFSKELSDEAKDEAFDISDTFTVTATTTESNNCSVSEEFKYMVKVALPEGEVKLEATIFIGANDYDGNSSLRIDLFGKDGNVIGKTEKGTFGGADGLGLESVYDWGIDYIEFWGPEYKWFQFKSKIYTSGSVDTTDKKELVKAKLSDIAKIKVHLGDSTWCCSNMDYKVKGIIIQTDDYFIFFNSEAEGEVTGNDKDIYFELSGLKWKLISTE